MTLPPRKAQIERIAKFLDADHTEGRELAEIAGDIVDAFHGMYIKELKDPPLTPHVGMAFKHPALSGVWHVAHERDGVVWIVSATTKYGAFFPATANLWSYATTSTAKAGVPGNNPDWKAGDRASTGQRAFIYEVLAAGDKCVLLLQPNGEWRAESNDNMSRYYRREGETAKW